jgi:hypothetical protein
MALALGCIFVERLSRHIKAGYGQRTIMRIMVALSLSGFPFKSLLYVCKEQ